MKNEDNNQKLSQDEELEEILKSLKNFDRRVDRRVEKSTEERVSEPISAPAPRISSQPKPVEKVSEPAPVEPPKPIVPPKPVEAPASAVKEQKKVDDESTSAEDSKKEPKSSSSKKVLLAIVGILIVSVLGLVIYNVASTAYLRPYKAKYDVKFPRGIAEEFCDAYGNDTNVSAKLAIPAIDADTFITNENATSDNHFDAYSTMNEDQQFRAISISKKDADIESLFADAKSYKKSNQQIILTDIFGKSKNYQVVSSYYVTTNAIDDDGYLFPYNLAGNLTEDSFNEYEDRVSTRSLFYTGYDLRYEDSYLTISTESDFMDDFRFVILCVQVDEVTPIKKTQKNEKIHYPQVWYDRTGEHNPYWLSSKWRPSFYTDSKHNATTYHNN